jgi:hypothetical protein
MDIRALSLGGGAIVMISSRLRVFGDLASRAMAGLNPAQCVFLTYVTLLSRRRNGSIQS